MASLVGRSASLARPEAAELAPDAGALGPGALGIGAPGSALLASSCCLLPVTPRASASGALGIGALAPLAPWQPAFLAISLLCLAAGFWLARRRPAVSMSSGACAASGACASPGSGRAARAVLWAALALVALVVAFEPILLPWLLG